MQLRMSGDGQADARVLQQAVTTLTECVSEHDAGFLSMLDVSAFRVRDQRVAKLVAVGPLDDLVGLNELSFEGIEPARMAGLYPALSGDAPLAVRVNLGDREFVHGPPDASFLSMHAIGEQPAETSGSGGG